MIFIANWKMYRGARDSVSALQELEKDVVGVSHEIVVAPSFPMLAHRLFQDTSLKLAAQNVSSEQVGQYTGEVSPRMLKELRCEYVIIGHSERRKLFNETNEIINKKILAALHAGLKPIMCVGESKAERESGGARKAIDAQLKEALKGVTATQSTSLVIAYEPVWAISPGGPAEPEDVFVMARLISDHLKKLFGENNAKKINIIYGGSVNHSNVKRYSADGIIKGFLIGKGSVLPDSFSAIIKNA